MTRAQCLALSAHVVRAAGFRSFAALYDVVINKGFTGQASLDAPAFTKAQGLFHMAQDLRWAADAKGAERSRWVACAYRRTFLMWLTGQAA